MSDHQDRLLQLASPDHPDHHSWAALCQALDRCPPDQLPQATVACLEPLQERWPADLERTAPMSWLARQLSGSDDPRLALCTHLDLAGHGAGDDGITQLAGAPLDSLRALNLRDNKLGPKGLTRLLPRLTGVEQLELGGNKLGKKGAAALAVAPLESVAALTLSSNNIGDAGLQALARAPWLGQLQSLVLRKNKLGPDAITALAQAPMPRLTELDLSKNPLGDAGCQALAHAPWLATLQTLRLNGADLGPGGIAALAQAPLEALRLLSLTGNPLQTAGAQALASAPWLARVRRLDLLPEDVDKAEGARALVDSPHLNAGLKRPWKRLAR